MELVKNIIIISNKLLINVKDAPVYKICEIVIICNLKLFWKEFKQGPCILITTCQDTNAVI